MLLLPQWRAQSIAALMGGSAGFLDGISGLTGAWSPSRVMLSSYGGALYNLTSGAVDTWNDQSGSARNFVQASSTVRPVITATGPNNRDMVDFDGTDDFMDNGSALSTFIANNAGYVVAAFYADDVASSNEVNIYDNDAIWCDAGAFAGVHIKTSNLQAYNFDGSVDVPTAQAVVVSTMYVVAWWHEGGNLNQRINRGTTNTIASGNTSTMTNVLRVGKARTVGGTGRYNGKLGDIATFNAVPAGGTRDTIEQNIMDYYGAV